MTNPYDYDEWVNEYAEVEAMDRWLDHLETLCIALTQRRMTKDQLDRYGRVLQGAELDALRRIRGGPRTPRMIRRKIA